MMTKKWVAASEGRPWFSQRPECSIWSVELHFDVSPLSLISQPSIHRIHIMSAKALTRAFPKALKEVRLHLCQTGQASEGARYVAVPFLNQSRSWHDG